jgi:hypothetical protein
MKRSNHLVKLIVFIGGITLLTSCFPAYVAVRPVPPPVIVRPAPPYEGAVWVELPGHWEDRPRGSVWISGHWR